jgi:hypothetical protein
MLDRRDRERPTGRVPQYTLRCSVVLGRGVTVSCCFVVQGASSESESGSPAAVRVHVVVIRVDRWLYTRWAMGDVVVLVDTRR